MIRLPFARNDPLHPTMKLFSKHATDYTTKWTSREAESLMVKHNAALRTIA